MKGNENIYNKVGRAAYVVTGTTLKEITSQTASISFREEEFNGRNWTRTS